jgi:hypothetical protein
VCLLTVDLIWETTFLFLPHILSEQHSGVKIEVEVRYDGIWLFLNLLSVLKFAEV